MRVGDDIRRGCSKGIGGVVLVDAIGAMRVGMSPKIQSASGRLP